jgi:ABC-type sugar transport system, permease component
VINIIVIALLCLTCLLPLWYTLCVSLSNKSAAAGGMVGLWPIGFNLNAYAAIMNDRLFFNSLWISAQRVILGTVISLLAIVLMAYPLSRSKKEFGARNIFMWILVFCMLFNGGLIPWYMTMKSLNLINNIFGLVLGGGLPVFNVILVMNFFRNLPKEMEEAALVDGAGPWRILLSVLLPLSVPVLATVTLFTIVYHWNEFFQSLVLMSTSDKYPLQTYIQQLVVVVSMSNVSKDQFEQTSQLSNQTLNAAKIFIAMVPVLIIYPFLQKYFVTGITLGAVKE